MFPNKFKLLLVVTLVSVLAVTSVLYFVKNSPSANDSDTPPMLSLGGEGVQGKIEKGAQGFLQFEEDDEDDFDDFKDDYEDEHDDAETIALHAGVNYVSPLEDTSVEELINCIDPEADRVLLAQYDADEGKFLTYPKGPFGDDTEKIDDTDYEFKAGKGVVIIARHDADAYCLAEAEKQSDVDITHPMDEDVRGWVLLHSNEDNVEDFIKPFEDRVDLVWKMTDDNEFEKVKKGDYDEDLEDFHMVWVKLTKGENGGDDVSGDVAPKELSFTAQAGAGAGFLTWKISPETYKDKDITGYMLSVREEGQGVSEAVKTYVTESDWAERNGVITLVLGEIVAGDVYLVRVGAVYDGEKDQPYYTEEIRVTIIPAHSDEAPRGEAPSAPGNVTFRYFENNGDYKIGISWDAVASKAGATFKSYTVRYFVCDDAAGARCGAAVDFTDNGFDDISPGQIGQIILNPTVGKYYKAQVGVSTEQHLAPVFSSTIMSVQIPVEEEEGAVANPGDVPTKVVITKLPANADDLKSVYATIDLNSNVGEGALNNCLAALPCVVAAINDDGAAKIITKANEKGGAADYAVSVMITSIGDSRLQLIKLIRVIKGFSLQESKNFLEQPLPITVVENYPLQDAEAMITRIEATSAQASTVLQD